MKIIKSHLNLHLFFFKVYHEHSVGQKSILLKCICSPLECYILQARLWGGPHPNLPRKVFWQKREATCEKVVFMLHALGGSEHGSSMKKKWPLLLLSVSLPLALKWLFLAWNFLPIILFWFWLVLLSRKSNLRMLTCPAPLYGHALKNFLAADTGKADVTAQSQNSRQHCRRLSIFMNVVSLSFVLVSFHVKYCEWDSYLSEIVSTVREPEG